MKTRFRNRTDAGQKLAQALKSYANCADVLILGLPRGGVPVAYEIAKALNAPLDICIVRKLGVPGHKELAMGAIASGGVRICEVSSFLRGQNHFFTSTSVLFSLTDFFCDFKTRPSDRAAIYPMVRGSASTPIARYRRIMDGANAGL